jgi:hypothetical protein
MNSSQWLCELEGLYYGEDNRVEEMKAIGRLVRLQMVQLLGLNLMPMTEEVDSVDLEGIDPRLLSPEDAQGGGKVTKLRRATEFEIMPLALLCGNNEVLMELYKKNKEFIEQEEMDQKIESGDKAMSAEDLEQFMRQNLSPEDDLVFVEDPAKFSQLMKWNSEETQNALAQLVQPMSEKDDYLLQGTPKGPTPLSKKSRVTLG